ncbi:MAG: metalloregulator ArsR/SmtB family transcription factor [Acidimicrobiales bacterium]|nr:metalloregulator ArsR/SmtB family transcription factor [Acidimicrobiales bacterium]
MAGPSAVNSVPAACCSLFVGELLSEEDAGELARMFAALADPARLRLLNLLAAAEDGEVCACDLVVPLGKSQPTVSHHLKVLSQAGLVRSEKRGRWVWYAVATDRLAALRQALTSEED